VGAQVRLDAQADHAVPGAEGDQGEGSGPDQDAQGAPVEHLGVGWPGRVGRRQGERERDQAQARAGPDQAVGARRGTETLQPSAEGERAKHRGQESRAPE
jgi:hypothetical protein